MNKTEIVAAIAEQMGISKKAASDMLNSFLNIVITNVKEGNTVRLQGFGTFAKSMRKEKMGVNPQKPTEKIKIPAMNVVTFKVGSEFKKEVRASK